MIYILKSSSLPLSHHPQANRILSINHSRNESHTGRGRTGKENFQADLRRAAHTGRIVVCPAWMDHFLQPDGAFLSFLNTFLAMPHGMWIFLSRGLNPCSLHWEHTILITGQPGKSQLLFSKIIVTRTSIYFHG